MNSSNAAISDRSDDQLALNKLVNAYHWHAEPFDWDAWADCHTVTAEFDFAGELGVMRGRREILETCMDHVYDTMQHVMMNLEFEITGDAATA